jgi:hypothetical protein
MCEHFVPHIKGGTYIEGAWEKGAEGHSWT